jgi:2,5-diamino-6-(ribosylamino)-4(3H)-pyrimidinone 5'-phosphate reductase
MPLHYQIVGSFNADMHLVGSNTAEMGIDLFLKEIPQETKNDFKKPNNEGVLWTIPDTAGKLKGLLHIFRQSEYCKDVIVLISRKTSKEYIRYLKKRDYDYHIVGEDKCNLKQALEHLNEKYNVKIILTDTGSILSNLLLKLGLVTEISLLIHPVVVGKKAYNMFAHLEENLKLELIREKSLEKGCVWNLYRL